MIQENKKINNICKLVLEAKLQNLPFAVLKNAIKNPPNKQMFDKFYFEKKSLKKRLEISKEDLKIFGEWAEIERSLANLYGNISNQYNTIIKTEKNEVDKVFAVLHNDTSDVVHFNCYGEVEWLLIDPDDFNKTEHKIIMQPGDVMYMKGWTLHETTPYSERGSLIFMNLPYEEIPEGLNFETQREDMLKQLDEGLKLKK
jgi:hypothetical protein